MSVSVRVLTFNIHAGIGVDGRLDLGRIADVIRAERPQVVGLQEVDRHFGARSGDADQPRELAHALGRTPIYHPTVTLDPTEPGGPRREYGHAVLAGCDVVRWDHVPLPCRPGHEPRGVLRVWCTVGGAPFSVWNVHLANEDGGARVEQSRALRRLLDDVTGPVVVLGDLNAEPTDEPLRILTGRLVDAWSVVHGGAPGHTFDSAHPKARIDYVLTTPDVRVVAVEVVDVGEASDHRAVVADLELSLSSEEAAERAREIAARSSGTADDVTDLVAETRQACS